MPLILAFDVRSAGPFQHLGKHTDNQHSGAQADRHRLTGTESGVADIVVLHVHAVQINFRKLKRSLEVQIDMSVSEWMIG